MISTNVTDAGISSIGLAFPRLAMDVRELADLRGVDPDKFTLGLGCGEMALCAPGETGETVVDLAVTAARRALSRWGGSAEDIGLLAVGTESAVDMSRPLSAWVADALGLRGAVRSYEVKHACYGGTLALRQALEWKLAGAVGPGKAALVIAADVALYAPGDPGEPTQGAGAVAMVVDEPAVAAMDRASFAWSEPEFDFWRPVGESYPSVDGPLSLDCYRRGTRECFRQWIAGRNPAAALAELDAVAFHVPFPKMVKKAVLALGESFGWGEDAALELFRTKVDPTMEWNRRCGNAYTASLWISVARALAGAATGERIGAFSYGSGFGAELTILTAGPDAEAAGWTADVEADLERRDMVDAATYRSLRGEESKAARAA